ncbi:hypothetical protein ACHAW5_000935 [Stephanodiscus triporus]|uniref:Uncharacterized protein n=1 Tax=Stephanodiscus triporus TaxID=2934178 RepID=A0ABD3PK09_9STRA
MKAHPVIGEHITAVVVIWDGKGGGTAVCGRRAVWCRQKIGWGRPALGAEIIPSLSRQSKTNTSTKPQRLSRPPPPPRCT